MKLTRRRAFWSVLLAAQSAPAQNLRDIYTALGLSLPEDRIKTLTPVLARRQANLTALRQFPIQDTTPLWPRSTN